MYFRKKCDVCDQTYDAMEQNCPNCGNKNETNPDAQKFPRCVCFPFWKQLTLFGVGWLGFQIIALVVSLFAGIVSKDEIARSAIVNFGAYFILIIGLSLIVWVDWKKLFSTFKNWKPYVFGIAGFFAIMTFTVFYNIIIQVFGLPVTDNTNQESANKLVTSYPILAILVLGIIGPVCEELTYRVGLFSFFRRINRVWGYVITMIIFAFIHFDWTAFIPVFKSGDASILINEFINLPFYLFAGLTFSFLYEKFGFAGSLIAHIANNLYSVIVTLLAAYFPAS